MHLSQYYTGRQQLSRGSDRNLSLPSLEMLGGGLDLGPFACKGDALPWSPEAWSSLKHNLKGSDLEGFDYILNSGMIKEIVFSS